MESFVVVIEKAETNYSAFLPDVPGCVSTGNTIEATIENIKEALEFHLEGLAEEKLALPGQLPLAMHLMNGDILLNEDVIIVNINIPVPSEIIV